MCRLIKLAEHVLLNSQHNLLAIHLGNFSANLRTRKLRRYYPLVVLAAYSITGIIEGQVESLINKIKNDEKFNPLKNIVLPNLVQTILNLLEV